MNHRTIIFGIACFAVISVGFNDAQVSAQQATRPQAATRPGNSAAHRPKPGVAYQAFYVVDPISAKGAKRFQSVLLLSEEQAAQFALLYKQYRAQDEAIRTSDLPALWERSSAVAASSFLEGLDSLLADASVVSKKIEGTETLLFENIALMLAPQQAELLSRVRRMRERQRAEVYSVGIPGANEDLSAILYGLQLDMDIESFDPAIREQVENYESLATTTWVQFARRLREKILLEHELFGPAMAGRSPEQNQVALDRFAESNQDFTRLEERLLQINQQYLRSIGDLLTNEQRRKFANLYNASAFPQVYPDPYDANEVLDCLCANRVADDPVLTAIESIRNSYSANVAIISENMAKRHVEWTTHLRAVRIRDDAGFVVHKKEMSDLQAQRAKEADTVIQQAVALVVTPTETCALALSEYRSRIAAHKPRVIGLTFRP